VRRQNGRKLLSRSGERTGATLEPRRTVHKGWSQQKNQWERARKKAAQKKSDEKEQKEGREERNGHNGARDRKNRIAREAFRGAEIKSA